ncbi:hypothetical protein GT94_06545 [Geobacillus stearothermophilus]|nr:hypothetical protein IB49_15550 [Geobacillus sp. LC300]KFL17219.1 hypothetical protein ET31_01920 [Geobacillus stearothermophilus]KFX35202.1 hypothetical protein GT94_06545 [Geobacillus stearothermophilus]
MTDFGRFIRQSGKEALPSEGLLLEQLGDQFFPEQIFPLLKQLFFQLFQHFSSLLTFYCTQFATKVNVSIIYVM